MFGCCVKLARAPNRWSALLFHSSQKDRHCRFSCLPVSGILIAVTFLSVIHHPSVSAQNIEPLGSYLSIGASAIRGAGVQVGYLTVQNFYTREISVLIDLRPIADPDRGSEQLAVTMGGSIRIFGFERTIGNAPYRGYDIDIGFRAGPGMSFSNRESRATRDRSFNLFLEPFLRYSRAVGSRPVFYLEAGVIRPHIRFGAWF